MDLLTISPCLAVLKSLTEASPHIPSARRFGVIPKRKEGWGLSCKLQGQSRANVWISFPIGMGEPWKVRILTCFNFFLSTFPDFFIFTLDRGTLELTKRLLNIVSTDKVAVALNKLGSSLY